MILKTPVTIEECQWISDVMQDESRDDFITKFITAHKKYNFGQNGVILTTFKRVVVTVDTPLNDIRVTEALKSPDEVLTSLEKDLGVKLSAEEKQKLIQVIKVQSGFNE